MSRAAIDPSTLKAFGDVAAGHDGVLSDPTGSLVIKPCTAAEVSFYESVPTRAPALAPYLPTYMGTLTLSPNEPTAHTAATAGTAATLGLNEVGPMHGKALTTDLSIVLENAAAHFKRPNILDLKLGARLWDDRAKPEKRVRLDKVSAETTSGSLGFRVAGMRVWQGTSGIPAETKEVDRGLVDFESRSGNKVYNKLYGRRFSAADITEGFKEYLVVPQAGIDEAKAAEVVRRFQKDVSEIEKAFRSIESRMYSASILFVYEGDGEAFSAALKAEKESKSPEDEAEDDDENEPIKVAATKLIDFAHASWAPGLGPDENVLQGVRSVGKILGDLVHHLEI